MARQRLINCDFLNESGFTDISNKAKLLYMFLIFNADDRGWCGKAKSIIETLEKNDSNHQQENLSLLGNSYECACDELVEKGFVLEFVDNHRNKIYLIRHWFVHNKYKKGLLTNYTSLIKLVELRDSKYYRKPLKESNININQDKPIQDNINSDSEISQEEWDRLCGGNDKQETTDNDDTSSDLPF